MIKRSPLTQQEKQRYNRQIILPEVGINGQEKLKSASVLIIGAGGLGNPVAASLVGAGIGKLGLIDDDVVDMSNLHRQTMFCESDVDRPKVNALAARLSSLNQHVAIHTFYEKFNVENAQKLIADYDIIVDACDNFATRYLISDTCVLLNKPNVSAAIYRFEGQLSTYCLPGSPCLRCVFPEAPPADIAPSCSESGVISALPNVLGALQANEVIKLILDAGVNAAGTLLSVDLLYSAYHSFELHKDPACPMCGTEHPHAQSRQDFYTSQYPPPVEKQSEESEISISTSDLHDLLRSEEALLLVDLREEEELEAIESEAGLNLPDTIAANITQLHLPYSEFSRRQKETKTAKRVIFFCAVGLNSTFAAMRMRDVAGQHYFSLKGGIQRWTNLG